MKLCTKDQPAIDYDSEYDVMNYVVGDISNSYGDEDVDNIVVFRDIDTDEVTGYTVLNFKRICKNKSKEYDVLSTILDIKKVLQACN